MLYIAEYIINIWVISVIIAISTIINIATNDVLD